jgi:hypothetical protein
VNVSPAQARALPHTCGVVLIYISKYFILKK